MSHFAETQGPDSEKYESDYITLWIEEGIMFGRYAPNLHVTITVAKSCVEGRIFFSKGKSYPLWVDMRGIASMSKEARQYLATMGATLVTAGALITGSIVNRAIGNIFLKIDRPPVPVKLFTDGKKARQWLMKFVDGGPDADTVSNRSPNMLVVS